MSELDWKDIGKYEDRVVCRLRVRDWRTNRGRIKDALLIAVPGAIHSRDYWQLLLYCPDHGNPVEVVRFNPDTFEMVW